MIVLKEKGTGGIMTVQTWESDEEELVLRRQLKRWYIEVLKVLCFVLIMYVGVCVFLSAALGTEWGGSTYYPAWHWPAKLLVSWL
jgi:hypothetical protein